MTIAITDGDKRSYDPKTNTLYLNYEYLALGIKSKGKLEAYLVSYVADKINKGLGLKLFHILFSFAYSNEHPNRVAEFTENYSKNMFEIINSFNKL